MTDEAVRGYLREIGRRGGKTQVEKYRLDVLRKIGSKGGRTRSEKYDRETVTRWAKKSQGARRQGSQKQ